MNRLFDSQKKKKEKEKKKKKESRYSLGKKKVFWPDEL